MSLKSIQKYITTRLIYFVYVIPILTLFVLFRYLPIFEGMRLSVVELNPAGPDKFVGLINFIHAFEDRRFIEAIGRTSYFMVSYMLGATILALLVALAVNIKNLKRRLFFKICFFLPVITSFAAIAYIMKLILSPSFGPIAHFMKSLGLESIPFLENKDLAIPTLVAVSIWKNMGFYIVIFLANLQMIDPTYYEAARCDGATTWQQFTYITFHLLLPAIGIVVIMSIISGFQVFTSVLIMTAGGPGKSTEVLMYYAFVKGFQLYEYGYGSAISIMLFSMILLITTIPRKIFKF